MRMKYNELKKKKTLGEDSFEDVNLEVLESIKNHRFLGGFDNFKGWSTIAIITKSQPCTRIL